MVDKKANSKSSKKVEEKAPAKKELKSKTPAKKAVPAKKDLKGKETAKKATPAKKAAPVKKVQPKKLETENDHEDGDKKVRSFKVKLPGNEMFNGRFTGQTPYQAANKALSKYFRDNGDKKTQITFTIKESTRQSKRSEYSYQGERKKLDTPIEYSIKDANGENKKIIKQYKNSLKKIKKNIESTLLHA